MPVLSKSGLMNIFVQLGAVANLTAAAFVWANDSEPYVGPVDFALVSLKLLNMRALGVDEHRRTWDGTAFTVTELGNREVVVQVRVKAYDYQAEPAEILDIFRTVIRSDAITQLLTASNLALEWVEPTVPLPLVEDNRIVACAVCDFRFGGVANYQSSSTTIISPFPGWIDTVDGTTNGSTIPGDFT